MRTTGSEDPRQVLLIVDDSEMDRTLLRLIFSRKFLIEEAKNGVEALQKLRALPRVDIVTLDIMMPELDGLGVLEAMRSDNNLRDIPVIVATDINDEDMQIRALELGADDIFNKPVNSNLIQARVNRVLLKNESVALKAKLQQQDETLRLMQYDHLTGLMTQEAFYLAADQIVHKKPAGSYAISVMDIDGFKVINDQYGREEGDRLLRLIAEHLRSAFRGADGVCCRIYADNFAAILPPDKWILKNIAEQCEQRITTSSPYSIRFSIGRYVADDLTLSVQSMTDRAVIARRTIKGRYDKHIVSYGESMRKELILEQDIVGRMDKALQNGEFTLYIQPQYNHEYGSLTGAEALVRWLRPGKTPVSPSVFIPIFEQNGFIFDLDRYVWEQAAMLLRKWIDKGLHSPPLSVNVSRCDILHHDFHETITSIVKKYDIPSGMLRLEITETAFSKDAGHIISAIKKLRESGFTVGIDDFGSGYSSFNTLKDVPVDVLKIDLRFLENSEYPERSGNILESIVRMSKWLNMSVITEGVETREQADFLGTIGCSEIQGYFYARPMPTQDYEELLENCSARDISQRTTTVAGLDKNSFWAPDSIDTLIFNSYVGGACVAQYGKSGCELIRVNDAFLDAMRTNLTKKELTQHDLFSMLSPEDSGMMREKFKHALETGVTEHGVYRADLSFDNPPHVEYIRFSVRVIIKFETHSIVYMLAENITGQKLAEQKEFKANELLRSIMARVGSGICAFVVENGIGRVAFANDSYFSIFGYTREQHEKEITDTLSYVHPEDRDKLLDLTFRILDTGEPYEYEYRCFRRNGSVIWVRCRASLLHRHYGEAPVILAEISDITAEREKNMALKDSNDQLRFLHNMSESLLTEVDFEEAIREVLTKIMNFFDGERCYIFETDYKMQVTSNTYEVCAPGVSHEIGRLQPFPFSSAIAQTWFNAAKRSRLLIIDDSDSLGDDRIEERDMLKAQGVHSLAAAFMIRHGELMGFIGVDNPKRGKAYAQNLTVLSDYMTVMLTRRGTRAPKHP